MAEGALDWDLYRTFLVVFREMSFTSAARQLGSTQPTVGRQIESLEAALGAKLFTRSPSGLVPTPLARSLVPYAESMSTAAAALERTSESVRSDEGGAVRLTAGGMVAVEMVPALVASFCHAHPRIDVEYSVTPRVEDLLEREADVAVRMARPSQAALVARRVANLEFGIFAHRRYVETKGLPQSPSDWPHHRLIGFDRDSARVAATTAGPWGLRREDFGIRTDDFGAQLALLRAGAGMGACPVAAAQRDPDLVRVLPGVLRWEREVWLVMHPDQRDAMPIRLLFDHLAEGFAAETG
jgi:DNA-binding transcriptional LysR family regulator